jgi:hypothetical protein
MSWSDIAFVGLICLTIVFLGIIFSYTYRLYLGSTGVLIISGTRSFYICRYTADDFLERYAPEVLDRWGQVFLADSHEIRRLKKHEYRTALSEDEYGIIDRRSLFYHKICVIRDHELTARTRQRLKRIESIRSYWPPPTSAPDERRRREDIVVG